MTMTRVITNSMCPCLVFFIFLCYNCAYSSKILGVFQAHSISHQQIFQAIWKELSLRGHQVTVISPRILNDKLLTNLTEIKAEYISEIVKKSNLPMKLGKNVSTFNKVLFVWNLLTEGMEAIMNDDNVNALLESDPKFDLVLLQGLHPLIYTFGYRTGAPIAVISSYGVMLHTHDVVGNPTHPVISPEFLMSFEDKLTFIDQVNSFLYNIWYRMLYYWYELPKADRIARKYLGNDMPYLGDIERNTSLVMVNVNPIMHKPRANVPNVIEIGQIHIKKRQLLPKDLQDYLDLSTRGVVYFSLGSNVKSATLSLAIRNKIVRALSELPYDVLWKWEIDEMPEKPENVLLRKWLPQQDILGHPNIKVFVTQGGIQSIEEAIVNGVPMVGIPFMSDQPLNVRRLTDIGLGLGVNFETMTKDELRDTIIEVVENKKYKEEVIKAKRILEDQPLKGVDKAIWWIEYVIRHKGAAHLRSPAADMSFYKYFMLDVIAFLLAAVALSGYIIVKILTVFISLLSSKTKLKSS